MGEGGAREKGDTRGELRGEDAALSSALEKIKAVSVRLRWYRLNGLPAEKAKGLDTEYQLNALIYTFFLCQKARLDYSAKISVTFLYIPPREDPGLVGLCEDDDSCLKNSRGFMQRWDTNTAASCRSSNVQRAQGIEMIKQT